MANSENISDGFGASNLGVATNMIGSEFVGSALQSAREARNMTVEEAARQLRLSTHQILALEQDNFAKLPDAMITRGFIRNYARLLDIDVVPLLQAYRLKMPDPGQAKLSLTSEHIVIKSYKKKSYAIYLLIALVLILSVAAWWFYIDENRTKIASLTNQTNNEFIEEHASDRPAPTAQDATSEALPPQALPAAERLAETTNLVQSSADGSVASGSSAVDTATVRMPIKPEVVKPESGTLTTGKPEIVKLEVVKPGNESIKFKATQQTWVQVHDTAGDVIYERTIAAGGIENFDFKPPAKVIIGNALGAQLFYKNQPIDLLSRAKNNVARITLE